jgi:hypothetical protein
MWRTAIAYYDSDCRELDEACWVSKRFWHERHSLRRFHYHTKYADPPSLGGFFLSRNLGQIYSQTAEEKQCHAMIYT